MNSEKSKISVLAQCAIMIALATVLSKIEIPIWIHGGSITAASMAPIILISYKFGTRWGIYTALTYSLFQMFLGFSNVLYCKTITAQILCILLDYILAFTFLGAAQKIGSFAKKKSAKILLGTASVCFIRFICSFISGIILWSEYAPAEQAVWYYSLVYNGGYMLPESIITVIVLLALSRFIPENQ